MKNSFFCCLFFLGLILQSCNETSTLIPKADVVIVQVNDIYEIDGVNGGKEGNLARVQGLVDSLKGIYSKVLLVHAGDFLNPSLMGNLKDEDGNCIKGKHMVEVMNAMSFDAVAFGNHEIDLKYSDLTKRLNEMQFDMISANLFYKDSVELRPFTQSNEAVKGFKTFDIETKRGIKKLSLLSVILPYNKKDYVHYTSVDSVVETFIQQNSKEYDGLFLLSHLNRAHDKSIGIQNEYINLIMGGHDHYNFCDTVGSERYVTKADANARTAWIHYVNWNENTQEFISSPVLISIDSTIQKNGKVEKVIQNWKDFAAAKTAEQGYDMNQRILEIDYPLDAREESIRSQQTDFGKLVCEAMASVFDTADVVVLNSGSVRYDDLILNPVTQGDILKALPFGGSISGTYMSGEMVLKIFESSKLNNSTGGYLQVLQVPKEISEFGMYYVITTGYMSAGRENNLGFLKDFDWEYPKNIEDNQNDIRKIIIDFLAAKKPV